MAIVHRRGKYEDFDKSKMKPAEFAVVLENDPISTDGKAAYIAFSAGNVKKLSTHEDMVHELDERTEDIINELTSEVGEALTNVRSATEYANNAGDEAYQQAQAAETAKNEANAVAQDLISRRDAGEFDGPPGPQGPKGEDGADGVITTLDGQFGFQVRDGHLYLIYVNESSVPDFEINENGHLIMDVV